MKTRYWVFVFLFAFGLLSFWFLLKDYQPGPKRGSKAPEFSLLNRSNQRISLENFQGKLLLLNFWATWCAPCVEEMESLEKLYQKLKSKGFEVIAVSLDEEGWKAIDGFLKRTPVTFTILLDEDFSIAQKYGTYRVPESFLIGRNGEVLEKIFGPQDWVEEKMVRKIEGYLNW